MSTESKIARLIANTRRRTGRVNNIIEIATDIENLKLTFGNMEALSSLVGISSGMLNKFLSVNKLSPQVQDLVKERKIDSVEVVASLSKFEKKDQETLADLLVSGKISNQDLRLIHPFKKVRPDLELSQLIKALKESKNQKVSVIKFDKGNLTKDIEDVKITLEKIIGKKELLAMSIQNGHGSIRITPYGEKQLRTLAKSSKQTLQNLIQTIL